MLSNFSLPDDLSCLKVVVLTGAGISAESGLKTFRDNNGLWENHSVHEVATPEGFSDNPSLVYRFYNERRKQLFSKDVKPNMAHYALAKLEEKLADNLWVVTQNVDNLHQRAGSKNIIHMHGSLLSARCLQSGRNTGTLKDIDSATQCKCCQPSSGMRPDIVWFGEIPMHMERIESLLREADLFISIGTSGTVYPAAGFVNLASHYQVHCVELNLEPSDGFNQFSEKHYGSATQVVTDFVDTLLEGY
ncbi:Sir2 family NAD+-dependent deacetylase [Paraglaciecola sp.]|uniref:Sir2 family NAD+-dependent deacetylase n=1 Tax=Paraglaciecola sp. TaxID=1920173 RepID=UPI0032664C73